MTLQWSCAGMQFKARRRPWNQNLHPRDGTGKFIQNGDPVLIDGTVGGGRGTVIGARGGLISVRLSDGRVVNIARNHLRIVSGVARPAGPARPAPAATAARPAAPVRAARPETFAHPGTGEPVAAVRDRQGRWRMVNPKLIDRDGTPHVRTFDLDDGGNIGTQAQLRPASEMDLRSAGKFPGTVKAPRHTPNTARAGDGRTDQRWADDANTLRAADIAEMTDQQLVTMLGDEAPRSPGQMRALMAEARRRGADAKVGVALNFEEQQIAELVAKGTAFRNAYAEVFGLKPEVLAELERASLVDVDRIAGRVLSPAERGLYRELVYLTWLTSATDPKVAKAGTKAAGGKTVEPGRWVRAALAGYVAADAGLPITACPYDPDGSPAQRMQVLAFVRAYARRRPPTRAARH